jgi:hypothetical protein
MTLPVIYFVVKWACPESPALSHPPAATTSAATEEVSPALGNPTVIKKVFGSAGKDLRTVTYRMSKEGNPLTCHVADESGSQLVKCRFGYSARQGPTYGELVEVQMLDARSDPSSSTVDSGKKDIVLRRIVRGDAKELAPVTINIAPSDVVETILGTALVGFNPMIDWNSASAPSLPR